MRTCCLAALALLTPTLAAAAAPARPAPKTIVVVRDYVKAVAQDGPWLAWARSDANVSVRQLTRRKTWSFTIDALGDEPLPFALARGRVLWSSYESGNDTYEEVNLAVAGSRRFGTLATTEYDNSYFAGTFVGGMAGDCATLVFSTVNVDLECRNDHDCTRFVGGGRVWRVVGRRKIAIAAPPSFRIAASGSRIALVALPPRAALPHNGRIEIRAVKTGRLSAAFDPGGSVLALALGSRIAAVIVVTREGRRFAWFDSRTGASLGSVAVEIAPRAVPRVSVSGDRVLVSVDRRIQLFDTRTKKMSVVAVARGRAVDPSIERDRVVWAEPVRGGYAIRALRVR